MTISCQRLGDMIRDAEATSQSVQWIGPPTISVRYVRPESQSSRVVPASATVAHPLKEAGPGFTAQDLPAATWIDPIKSARLVSLIRGTLERMDPDTPANFELIVDPKQPALQALIEARSIYATRWIGPVQEGSCSLEVTGRGLGGPVQVVLPVTLKPHPMAVVPRRNFARGTRLTAADLSLQPVPNDKWDDEYSSDPQSLIGKEVFSSVRAGKPIKHSQVGDPILIRRGDLVELQVIGGGVRVTINARATQPGSLSSVIEVETDNPRKRHLARVVSPSTVQILTRSTGALR
ncbi:MAG: flagellar basal body P-ring formation chaperone FlgA [Planctomycetota bacterium]